MKRSPLRLLILSTPVGPLGSGLGGGIELTLKNLVQVLGSRGHRITVVAPEGSVFEGGDRLVTLPGAWQPTAHTHSRAMPVTLPEPSVLSAMGEWARQHQAAFDLILHFAYDWLPFYLTPFFQTPIAHFVSMGSLSDAMDQIIGAVATRFPGTIGVCTRVQAETFPFADACRPLGSALDLSLYDYCETPGSALAWMGRISPEKGLEDAIAAAQRSQTPLKILGKVEAPDYWAQIQAQYPDAPIEYLGFLPTQELQAVVRSCRALLMTPKWVEAFGNVAIEALACGVPVIAYRRGGPIEIVRHGETGWLVEPDSVDGLVQAIARIDDLDRRACRHQAETEFSLAAWGDRFEQWFTDILTAAGSQPSPDIAN
jgi:UDP-glucose:tetrahydrobiopterin glucosyltransferase